MRNRSASEVLGSSELRALVRQRWMVSLTLTAAILVVYFRNRGSIAVEDINVMKG